MINFKEIPIEKLSIPSPSNISGAIQKVLPKFIDYVPKTQVTGIVPAADIPQMLNLPMELFSKIPGVKQLQDYLATVATKEEKLLGVPHEITFNIGGQKITSSQLASIVIGFITPEGEIKGKIPTEKLFQGLPNLSTKLLERFRGMSEKIKIGRAEEIINLTKKQGLRPTEEEMFRSSMVVEKGEVNLPKTAAKVEEKLVPLTSTPVKSPRWSSIGEEFIGDGKYGEIVYQSPIKTSAGEVHFAERYSQGPYHGGKGKESFPNYFSHIRYEDMADGKTRKILETQSDLFQKGRLEEEANTAAVRELGFQNASKLSDKELKLYKTTREQELAKLQPYSSNDPLAHLRTFREEVKRAAQDGKDTLLIPSGETAMNIERLGQVEQFQIVNKFGGREFLIDRPGTPLDIGSNIGQEVYSGETHGGENVWIITDNLGDGKFKAVPKSSLKEFGAGGVEIKRTIKQAVESGLEETFDISGKVDTQHFVYKLNEEAIPREARKMGLQVEGKVRETNTGKIVPVGTKTVESNRPGEWWQIRIPKERAKLPVEAFGVGLIPFAIQKDNESQK